MGLGGGKSGPNSGMLNKIPILGALLPNPTEQFKKDQLELATQAYGAMRPEMAQARMNALSNLSTAYQPMNNAMATMYGAGNSFNPDQMLQSPMGPSMMAQGQSEANMRGEMAGGGPLGGLMGGSGTRDALTQGKKGK
jgi:hypothetical protein